MSITTTREDEAEMIINDDRPVRVTIICVTYNQVIYIRQCLESLVSQKTTFKYEIYVGDDCSADGTTDIVLEFAEKYPDMVIPYIREENLGSIRNFGDLCERVESDYIAFCDGDDYWIDENRLQKQFVFMETHPDHNGCFCRAKIQIEDKWGLEKYYKKNKNGELIWPDCLPGYKAQKSVNVAYLTNMLVAQSANTMLRYNKDIQKLPEWFYDSIIGDAPFVLLHTGKGKMGAILDIMCVYRRSDSGVFFSDDADDHFMSTRLAYITYLTGLNAYFRENFDGYACLHIENRIKLEVANYLNVILKCEEYDRLHELLRSSPETVKLAFNTYLGFYWDSRRMTGRYTWAGNIAVARDPYFMRALTPVVKGYVIAKKILNILKAGMNKIKGGLRRIFMFVGFWLNAIVPKNKEIWAFSSFHANKYMDNTKYLYEYVLANHPEIKPVWLTRNKEVYRELKDRNMPVELAYSLAGSSLLSKAAVAVTDHYRLTDFSNIYGFNARTKVVQLWHGVGIKAMAEQNSKILKSVPNGVRHSEDILSIEGEGLFKRALKRVRYFFCAPYRELFEKYLMFVCPGQERIDMIAKLWGIPESAWFMAGHPRDINIHTEKRDITQLRVLYAPTFRFSPKNERGLVQFCLDAAEAIQKKMEELDGIFTIRLHPHTWRNYSAMIKARVRKYDRIEYDTTPDIYETLHNYSIAISDYSSIAYDVAMTDRPVIFLCYDYDSFILNEPGFNLDYMKMTPGPKTFTWDDTLKEVEKYAENPRKDSPLRQDICSYFFDSEVNNQYNSMRIVEEIKNRTGFSS